MGVDDRNNTSKSITMLRHMLQRGLAIRPARLKHADACRPHFRHVIRSSSGASSSASKPDIKELAKMAQIGLTEQEAKDFAPQINSILDWFGQLQAVDVSGVPPAVHMNDRGTPLRPDQPHAYEARAQLLAQAPSTEGAHVRVPKTVTGADAGQPEMSPAASPASPAAPAAVTVSQTKATVVGGGSVSASEDAAGKAALLSMDFRVGKILACEHHPEAESLYVEKIDVGEPEPRTIVSGLVKYVPLEQMMGRLVVVAANLKPRNMRGIRSAGMLLATSDNPKTVVELITPPPGAQPGERIWFGDDREQPAPAAPNTVDKKKLWDAVAPGLCTTPDKVAAWRGVPMMTSAGPVTSPSLPNASIG